MLGTLPAPPEEDLFIRKFKTMTYRQARFTLKSSLYSFFSIAIQFSFVWIYDISILFTA